MEDGGYCESGETGLLLEPEGGVVSYWVRDREVGGGGGRGGGTRLPGFVGVAMMGTALGVRCA